MEYGLIGEKLGHSYSKEIHAQIGAYSYELKEIAREELDSFMTKKDFKGINVTIPYKQAVIPYLDSVDPNAMEIGAVNTVVNRGGKLYGWNTDFIGLKRLVERIGIKIDGSKVLVLGTGGTSRTARTVAKSLNAAKIVTVSRSASEDSVTYDEAYSRHADADFIFNTTPCGMFPNTNGSPIDVNRFANLQGVVDVIYNPLRTNLVISAQKNRISSEGGLFMLVQQAIAASEYFFDTKIDAQKSDQIFRTILSKKRNIVLIGMPGSGKTTVGKKLAKLLGRKFYDTDVLVTQKEKKTPAEIINEKGEEYFRNLESGVCAELSSITNGVVATGGGLVLREENVALLKQNGILVFLDRDIQKIRPTDSRPLSDSIEKLKTLYEKRKPIYTAAADFTVNSDESVQHSIQKIKEALL